MLLALWLSAAPASAQLLLNKIVAVVNGEIITLFDLQKSSMSSLARAGVNPKDPLQADTVKKIQAQVLDRMITDKLFVQAAERSNMRVSDAEVENQMRQIFAKRGLSFEEGIAKAKQEGVEIEEFEQRIRNNILSNRVVSLKVSRKIVVTKEDIAAYYEEHKSDFASERSVGIKLLMLPPTADADAIFAKVSDGSLAFEDAVAQYSAGPGKESGGSMGVLKWKDIAPEWKTALDGLAVGDVSKEIDVNGYRSKLKMDSSTDGDSLSLEQVSDEIERRLRAPMMEERYKEYSKKLHDDAVIDIRF